jgi:uncharacterized protein
VTIITDPLFYALAVPGVIALGLAKGGLTGVGQMTLPVLALVMPPLEAAAIMLPIMIVQDWSAVWVYRQQWHTRILATMIPGGLIGIALAGLLASYISDAAVRLFIGITAMIFVLYNWTGALGLTAKKERKASIAGGVFWGALSGFTSTICQAGGPPYQMYVVPQNLPKLLFVGTTAMFFATVNAVKVIPYFFLGQFSTKGLGTSLVLLPLAIAANQLGFWLVRRIRQEQFYKITLILMLFIAIELTREGIMEIWHG